MPPGLVDALRAVDLAERELVQLSGLPTIEHGAFMGPPALEAITRVRDRADLFAPGIRTYFESFGRGLAHLRTQVGLCMAYHAYSAVDHERALISQADYEFFEHVGLALNVFYGTWGRLAQFLNLLLAWGVREGDVSPATIAKRATSDLIAADPWIQAVLASHATAAPLFKVRTVETHRLGHIAEMWRRVTSARSTDARATACAQEKLAHQREILDPLLAQFSCLRKLLDDLPDFLARQEATILSRS